MRSRGQRGIFFENDGSVLLGTMFTARDEPAPTVVILHGIPGIEKNHDLAHAFRDAGMNAVIFHYRGSWGSGGDYRISGIPSDVVACLDHLPSEDDAVDPDQIYLVGHSLGGWAALTVGADERVKAVVTISAVVDPAAVPLSEDDARQHYTPWLHGITPEDFVRQWAGAPPATEPASRLAKPLLVIHGGGDHVIPVDQAQLAHDAAPGPKELAIHPEADHAFIDLRPWLIERVVSWVERVASSHPGVPGRDG